LEKFPPLDVFYRLLLCRGFGNRLLQFVFGSHGKKAKNQRGRLITGWSEVRALHGPLKPRLRLALQGLVLASRIGSPAWALGLSRATAPTAG
jgi:hypothetical protein